MINTDYLQELLLRLLAIHSPSGYTDPIVREVSAELQRLGIEHELTRRGAIRARLPGRVYSPDRAIVTHVDTLGAMVRALKDNGRLEIAPVGTWSARFAEGARVSVFTDDTIYRGTILPLKASGHIFNNQVDRQRSGWEYIEVRVDEEVHSPADLEKLGIRVGDFVGVDSAPEILANGFINARHLDDKAGVATLLAVAKAVKEQELELPVDCHLLFTITEEIGSGASAVLHGDVAEMVTLDNGTVGPGQQSREFGVTVAMADSSGPFDYHLTHRLIQLCESKQIPYVRDLFRYYRCDSASALESGNDIRTALVAFGVDASHGYERTHLNALEAVGQLLLAYLQSGPVYHQPKPLGSLKEFPTTRKVDVIMDTPKQRQAVAQVPPDQSADG